MTEARLSSALQRRINEAIEEFLVRVKEKLEADVLVRNPRKGHES